jgi:hypothetical protein
MMRTPVRILLVGGAAAALLVTVAPPIFAQVTTSSRCAEPIARHAGHAPVAGPIHFRGIRVAAVPGNKVLLWTARATIGTVMIRGFRCADATPMRFWYRQAAELPRTIRPTTGDTSYGLSAPAGSGKPGYILWSKPGDWKLTVWMNGRAVGSFVLCVAVDMRTPTPCKT